MFISSMPIVYSTFLYMITFLLYDYVFKLIAQMTLENEKLQCYDNDAN